MLRHLQIGNVRDNKFPHRDGTNKAACQVQILGTNLVSNPMHGVPSNNQQDGMRKTLLNSNSPLGGVRKLPGSTTTNSWLGTNACSTATSPVGRAKSCSTATACWLGYAWPGSTTTSSRLGTNARSTTTSPVGCTKSCSQQQPAAWNAPGAANTGGQQPWEAPASSPDAWAQPQQGAAPWGQPGNQPVAPTAYGNGGGSGQSWSQPAQVADQWSGQPAQQAQPGAWSPGVQQAPPTTPPGGNIPWQQQGPGQAQQGFGASPFESPDGDRTMLRSTGGSQGIGMVRIEEGKEPGRIYEIRKESLSIGRSRESDIFLEDLAVSRLHASIISLGNNNYALRDEGSANGTKVNGQPVNKYQPYPLQEGDKIQLGQTVLVFARR